MLRRWRLLGLATGLVFTSATIVHAVSPLPPRPFWSLGEGNIKCDTWLKLRQEKSAHVLPEAAWVSAWVLGYVTAASNFRQEPSLTFGPGHQPTIGHPEVDAWIDKYCTDAVAVGAFYRDITDAADALIIELRRQATTSE